MVWIKCEGESMSYRCYSLTILLAALLAVGATVGCARKATTASIDTQVREATAAVPAAETVNVPDFVALVGESEFSKRNSEALSDPVWYGRAESMDAYKEAANGAGVLLEFIVLTEDDETFAQGSAGWPQGQEPAAGVAVAKGSTVKLVLMQESSAENSAADNPSGVHTPAKGSRERTALMDACRKYLSYEGLFIVDQLKVKGDRALAVITPESGGDVAVLYLAQPSGSWRVSYCVYSDGSVMDGQQQHIGEQDPDYMPESVYNEMENWLQ